MTMRALRGSLAGVALAVLLTACVQPIQPIPRQAHRFEPWQEALPPYVFEPGDEMDVKLLYNPEFSDRVQVSPDGSIYMPLVGQIQAVGLTPSQLAEALRERFAKDLRRPDVSVVPRALYSNVVYVGGQDGKPASYPLIPRMGVLQAIAAAGGLTDTAKIEEVVLLRRSSDGKPMLRTFDLRRPLAGDEGVNDIPLTRFDMIFVPRSDIAEVDLWIDQYITKVMPFDRSFTYSVAPGLVYP
mgnify:CR=1 FL=1